MNTATPKRAYRMSARAEAKQATRQRILEVFGSALFAGWYDELTLSELARDAGVSAPTLTNHFGDKRGLLLAYCREHMNGEISAVRDVAVTGDAANAIKLLMDDYEQTGDVVIRMLALEHRMPELRPVLDLGRAGHRAWITRVFEPYLPAARAARRDAVTRLVVATDIYAWQILRRDMKLSRRATHDHLLATVQAVVASLEETNS